MAFRVAVIGAGIAGSALARRLHQAGISVVIFEKSLGLSGRMATRRTPFGTFDHGAQYFTARTDEFRVVVGAMCEEGDAAPWLPDTFVGTPTMNAPARMLSDGIEIALGCEVTSLLRHGEGWRLIARDDVAASLRARVFDAVVLAVPAPQAGVLAATADIHLDGSSDVRMEPCLALMASFERPCAWVGTHMKLDHPEIAWIADNSTKPGRSQGTINLSVHATPQWSRDHLELWNDAIRDLLVRSLQGVLGEEMRPVFSVAHRWRYALVDKAVGEPFLWDSAHRLGACGDWCLGPKVELAFQSGDTLGRAMAGWFGDTHEI